MANGVSDFLTKDDHWMEKLITIIRTAGNDLTISIVTFLLFGTSCYLWLHGVEVPKELSVGDATVLAYWFKNYRDDRLPKTNGVVIDAKGIVPINPPAA